MTLRPFQQKLKGTPGEDSQLPAAPNEQAANGRNGPGQQLGYLLAPSGRNDLGAPSLQSSNPTSKALGGTRAFLGGDSTFPTLDSPVAIPG